LTTFRRSNLVFKSIALVLACLFFVNDLVWAIPDYSRANPSNKTTLAAESRFNRITPFFDKHEPNFRNMAGFVDAAITLKRLIIDAPLVNDLNVARAINKLNATTFKDGAVRIEKMEDRELAGNKYKCVVFNFDGGRRTVDAFFLKGYSKLHPEKQAALRKELSSRLSRP